MRPRTSTTITSSTIQQPDLNWNNPKVHEAFKNIIAFWLKRGVGGFLPDGNHHAL